MKNPRELHPDCVEVFQVPGPEVTHWWIAAYDADDMKGAGRRLEHDEAGVSRREWPLSELSVETIRERWGSGLYRVGWLAVQNGKRTNKGRSPGVRIGDPEADEPEEDETGEPEAGAFEAEPRHYAPAYAPPPPPMFGPDPFALLDRMQAYASTHAALIERESSSKLQNILALTQAILPARGPAPAPAADPQIAQAIGQLAQAIGTIGARLDALEAARGVADDDDQGDEDDGDDDDDDDDDDPARRVQRLAETVGPLVVAGVQAFKDLSAPPPPSAPPAPALNGTTSAPAPAAPAPAATAQAVSS